MIKNSVTGLKAIALHGRYCQAKVLGRQVLASGIVWVMCQDVCIQDIAVLDGDLWK